MAQLSSVVADGAPNFGVSRTAELRGIGIPFVFGLIEAKTLLVSGACASPRRRVSAALRGLLVSLLLKSSTSGNILSSQSVKSDSDPGSSGGRNSSAKVTYLPAFSLAQHATAGPSW
jgi:hypothetical protein